jgi:pyruvate-ferredoxin/flavodoxin oxidoreductase
VEQALAALESQTCAGVVRAGGAPPSAALAPRRDPAGPAPRNVFGQPVQEEAVLGPGDRVAVATGMALAGLRSSVFLGADELIPAHDALRDSARRLVPLVVHTALGDAGHAAYHAVSDAGYFQVLASSGQEAVDLTLLARWLSERALVPGLVVTDVAAVESLELPDEEMLRTHLGAPEELLTSPTEAQRLLFGPERPRLLAWFDADRPVATGEIQEAGDAARTRVGNRVFFWDSLAQLAQQGMQALSRRTGRPLSFVQGHDLEDAEIVLVGQGVVVPCARAVAEHLRRSRGWKVGVLAIPWLRPFPVAEVNRALEGRRALAVVEALGDAPRAEAPLFRELRRTASAAEHWVSATCSGVGPDPARLAGLCEMLRRRDPPRTVHLEPIAKVAPTGFPKRDALIQAVSNAYPELQGPALPEAESLPADPEGGRCAGFVGLEAELPPDALTSFARALAAESGGVVHGRLIRPEPDAWEARLRAAPSDFPDPGPRTPVSLLLVATRDARRLGNSLASVAPAGVVLFATHDAPERVWEALPAAWRQTARERELRLFLVPADFAAAVETMQAVIRGEQGKLLESGAMRALDPSELTTPRVADRGLPRLVSRVSQVRETHDSLPRFWGEVAQPRQGGARDGLLDPLTACAAVPAVASALEPEALAGTLPVLDAGACTGCGRCWSACPDSAIGVTAIGIEALFTAASHRARTEGGAADALRRAHKHLAGRLAGELTKRGAGALDAGTCREAWGWLAQRLNLSDEERPEYEAAFDATLAAVDRLQPVVSEPFFARVEQEKKGTGELLVLAVDPRACLGCGLCVSSCPEAALESAERTRERNEEFEHRWRTWENRPDTKAETLERASVNPDVGPLAALLLSRHCAQAQVGGAAGEPGSGERLAARLVVAAVEQHAQRRTAGLVQRLGEQRANLEGRVRELLGEGLSAADLDTLQAALADAAHGRVDLAELGRSLDARGIRASFDRRAVLRMTRVAGELDRHRFRLAEGWDGLGRARFGVVVAEGSVAEWAARYPRHPYYAPLTLAPAARAVELARGMARGLVAEHLRLLRTLQRAALEADPPPDRADRLDAIAGMRWEDLGNEERAACPPLLLLGDDAALLDQGFEVLLRLLVSNLPVKAILLDGRGRIGDALEPALAAMAHRRAFVLAGSVAHPDHLARGLADALAWPGPALVHLHAPSPERHGFAASDTLERARLAVEGRAHVLLRYDPAAEGMFGLRASIAGNPGLEQDWGGANFVEWAAGESRFAHHFQPLEGDGDLPLSEWLTLRESAGRERAPFVEIDGRRVAMSDCMARAAGERLAVWKTLRELTGGASPFTDRIRESLVEELRAEQQSRVEALESEYETRIADLRAGMDREALDRLTERLLALSGFSTHGPTQRKGT